MTDSDVEMVRRQLTVGVLGHVDHGKTALVRALTGIETDRLAEERERGLSIVPGFAWFRAADTCIDLIDAPGHQAFIRAMIGAASGIDAALVVVAANEGVMPQTREHVAIGELLGLRGGIVALTKSDLVDAAELERRRGELREFFTGTFLDEAEIVAVSAHAREGIEALKDALLRIESQRETDSTIPFFMPVDRSFTKSGFGRVTTGTVHAGSVRVGDELLVTPGAQPASVRGIQVHGESVEQAEQGDRAALNLRSGAAESIGRGTVVGHARAMAEGRRVDVFLEPVEAFRDAVKNGVTLRVLIGTAEAQAKLRILEHDAAIGGRLLAQLRCDRLVPLRCGQRFILRSNSPAQTVAGGMVIDTAAPRRRRFDKTGNARLAALVDADAGAAMLHYVTAAGALGIEKEELLQRLGIRADSLPELLRAAEVIELPSGRVCALATIEQLADQAEQIIQDFHEKNPQQTGMRFAELVARIPHEAHESLLQLACERLQRAGRIAARGDHWHLADFDPMAQLSEGQRHLVENIEDAFVRSGVASLSLNEIVGKNSAARESLQYLFDVGRVVRLQTRDRSVLALHAGAIESVREKMRSEYPYPREFAVKDVRDLLGTTRKHIVPLLEHLDATGFTLRKGDVRQLRK